MFKNHRRGRKITDGLSKKEKDSGINVRHQIISDAQCMQRILENQDFKRFMEILEKDRESLANNLLSEDTGAIKSRDERTRLIARINQIDRISKKPRSLVWQMKNLTEVRDVVNNPREAGSRK